MRMKMINKICAVVCCKMEVLCKFILAIIGIFINLTSSSFLPISSCLLFAILFIAEINYFFPNFYINPEILSYSDNQVFYYIYSDCGVIWLIDRITGITNKIHDIHGR